MRRGFAAWEVALVGVFLCCYGNKLLRCLGNVESTLDDLLGDQLHVGPWAGL